MANNRTAAGEAKDPREGRDGAVCIALQIPLPLIQRSVKVSPLINHSPPISLRPVKPYGGRGQGRSGHRASSRQRRAFGASRRLNSVLIHLRVSYLSFRAARSTTECHRLSHKYGGMEHVADKDCSYPFFAKPSALISGVCFMFRYPCMPHGPWLSRIVAHAKHSALSSSS